MIDNENFRPDEYVVNLCGFELVLGFRLQESSENQEDRPINEIKAFCRGGQGKKKEVEKVRRLRNPVYKINLMLFMRFDYLFHFLSIRFI